jgi:hypothetical protein
VEERQGDNTIDLFRCHSSWSSLSISLIFFLIDIFFFRKYLSDLFVINMEIIIHMYRDRVQEDGMIRDPMIVRVAGFGDVSRSATLHVNTI